MVVMLVVEGWCWCWWRSGDGGAVGGVGAGGGVVVVVLMVGQWWWSGGSLWHTFTCSHHSSAVQGSGVGVNLPVCTVWSERLVRT